MTEEKQTKGKKKDSSWGVTVVKGSKVILFLNYFVRKNRPKALNGQFLRGVPKEEQKWKAVTA